MAMPETRLNETVVLNVFHEHCGFASAESVAAISMGADILQVFFQ